MPPPAMYRIVCLDYYHDVEFRSATKPLNLFTYGNGSEVVITCRRLMLMFRPASFCEGHPSHTAAVAAVST